MLFSVPLKYTQSGTGGSYGALFCFFEKPPYCLSQRMHQFPFPTTVQKDSFFSHTSLLTLVVSYLLNNNHPNRWEVVSHCGFDSYFLDDQWCWAPFHAPVGHASVWLLWKNSYAISLLILKQTMFSFWPSVVWILYIFWIFTPNQMYDLQIFSSFHRLFFFHFINSFLCCVEVLVQCSHTCLFLLLLSNQKNYCWDQSQGTYPLYFLLAEAFKKYISCVSPCHLIYFEAPGSSEFPTFWTGLHVSS